MGIKVTDVAYVQFRAPELDTMHAYLLDFGMQVSGRTDDVLYMRGTDDEAFVHVTTVGEPGFAGVAFNAAGVDDLEVLAALDGFSDVEELDGPGGGRVVRGVDPNGHIVEVVAGRTSVGRLDTAVSPPRNDGSSTARVGATVRMAPGPAHVKRLGHVVLDVVDFAESERWYKEHLGLVTSDEVAIDDDRSLGAFLRCDRGAVPVDHHTLFLVGSGRAGFNHAAFEVHDFDDLMRGNTHMDNAGHTHQWGVGRHILGSQIYNYWLDPWGHMVEHWTDGDLFDNTVAPNRASIGDLLGSQWGPLAGGPPA